MIISSTPNQNEVVALVPVKISGHSATIMKIKKATDCNANGDPSFEAYHHRHCGVTREGRAGR